MIGSQVTRLLAIAAVAFAAGITGVFVGQALFVRVPPPAADFHQFVHSGLDLSIDQKARLDLLEQRFATRKRALELQLRSENARLASAIQAEHGNGAGVAAAVDRAHMAMGQMQKETIRHIFAMRQILRPDQARRFDAAVVRALTEDPK